MFKANPPSYRAVEHKSVVVAVRQQLLSLIREGKHKPGAKWPPERDLQVYVDMSWLALRKAIHTLVGLGLLVVRRGQGTFVRAPSSSAAIRSDVVSLLLLSEELGRASLRAALEGFSSFWRLLAFLFVCAAIGRARRTTTRC